MKPTPRPRIYPLRAKPTNRASRREGRGAGGAEAEAADHGGRRRGSRRRFRRLRVSRRRLPLPPQPEEAQG
jgi:hypothetical protein